MNNKLNKNLTLLLLISLALNGCATTSICINSNPPKAKIYKANSINGPWIRYPSNGFTPACFSVSAVSSKELSNTYFRLKKEGYKESKAIALSEIKDSPKKSIKLSKLDWMNKNNSVVYSDSREKLIEKEIDDKFSVAVIDMNSESNEYQNEARISSEILRSDLVSSRCFNVVDRNNMKMILSEQGFQQTGCTSQECAVKIGKLLNVNKIVSGIYSKIGEDYFISINMIDIESGEIIFSDNGRFESTSQLENLIRHIVNNMITNLFR